MPEHATLRGLLSRAPSKPVYFVPRDDLIGEVLVPSIRLSNRLDCMMGYFSGASLRDIAPGLSEYLALDNAPVRLLISPHLQASDLQAVRNGLTEQTAVLERRLRQLLGYAAASEDALVRHTLECLAWLLSKNRVQIRINVMLEGMFHPKVWILQDGSGTVTVSGSSNLTDAGLTKNLEQMRVEKSWSHPESAEAIRIVEEEFEGLWSNQRAEYSTTVQLPKAIEEGLIREYLPDHPPTLEEFTVARAASRLDLPQAARGNERVPAIPGWLNWENGPFAHQGVAVRAWEAADRRGILEMATGAGKTLTSLVAATRAAQELGRLLIVIAVPTRPLLDQWASDVQKFGLLPTMPSQRRGREKFAEVERSVRRVRRPGDVQCVIATHDLLRDRRFLEIVSKTSGPKMLIADEVHNLGSEQFQANPPDMFELMLGLSATPERQYDEAGTSFLYDLFGATCFTFGLDEAIGVCLVPYDYYVHPVSLSYDEVDRWLIATERIRRAQWSARAGDEEAEAHLQLLRNRRRRILDEAKGKLDVLHSLLLSKGPRSISHTLIYGSDKGPAQVDEINSALRHLGIRYHQLTSVETAEAALAEEVLTEFADGGLQVLTSKRVLDEGMNIPSVRSAYICASTTVERQWVQRRGRILRMAPGKFSAELHDFVVLPPDDGGADEDLRGLVRGELGRVDEFGRLARNAGAIDGPVLTVRSIVSRYLS